LWVFWGGGGGTNPSPRNEAGKVFHSQGIQSDRGKKGKTRPSKIGEKKEREITQKNRGTRPLNGRVKKKELKLS